MKCINYCQKQKSRIEGPWTFGILPTGNHGQKNPYKMVDIVNYTEEQLGELSPYMYNQFIRAITTWNVRLMRKMVFKPIDIELNKWELEVENHIVRYKAEPK